MEITTKPFFSFFFFFFFFLFTYLTVFIDDASFDHALGLPSYNGAEVYYLKGVIGLPLSLVFVTSDIYIFFFFELP